MTDLASEPSTAFLKNLTGTPTAIPPIWLMRQAGRYLPEYKAVRAQAGSFLNLCYDSDKAAEVTLQPIDRFDLDAAILFADILLIPHALGQNLTFVEGEGPRLDPVVAPEMLDTFRGKDIHATLSPVYETVSKVRAGLDPSKTLIGFAGAPWTVATYMMAGGPMKDPASLRSLYYQDRAFLGALIDIITDATVDYLSRQVDAGAGAIQLFDTWAGGLPIEVLDFVSVRPLSAIAGRLKAAYPEIPVILFPKGVGSALPAYSALEDCDGVGIDYAVDWEWAFDHLSPLATVQGGLDPLLLVEGGEHMELAIRQLVSIFEGSPFIFNLGHGIVPQTPPENVARLVEIVREGAER